MTVTMTADPMAQTRAQRIFVRENLSENLGVRTGSPEDPIVVAYNTFGISYGNHWVFSYLVLLDISGP